MPPSFNVSGILQTLDDLFETVVEVFSCIDHEYFVGYEDEERLVQRAINTSEPPVIASKWFLDKVFMIML